MLIISIIPWAIIGPKSPLVPIFVKTPCLHTMEGGGYHLIIPCGVCPRKPARVELAGDIAGDFSIGPNLWGIH